MTCECGYADECDGETAIFYPLQDGGMCSVRDCHRREEQRTEVNLHFTSGHDAAIKAVEEGK